MDSSDIRGYIQRFEDQGYKTWIRTTMILECLKTQMGRFLENETEVFHNALNGKIKLKEKTCIGPTKCDYKKVPTVKSAPNKLCRLCDAWKGEILSEHNNPNPKMVHWINTTPYLWPSHKWEVAKVYMSRGNMKHKSVDDFDISAFLTLMTSCRHFQKFVTGHMLTEVTNVRNQIMHSANFAVTAEDFQDYMGRIRALGEALGEKVPEFQSFSKDMAEIQNINFQLHFGRDLVVRHEGHSTDKYDVESILNMELKIMKDKMEYLSQLYDADRENMLTSEELQKVKSFLDMNHDLQEKLQPQWQRLEAVQAQHGLQINTLTERVGELEKHTVVTDEEFSSETLMYKNRLLERAKKYKWDNPVFSEQDESAGFRGQVEVHGETFLGSLVCKSKAQAHQAAAKKALQELATVIANEEAALGQAAKSQTAGSSFFAAVMVSLAVDVSPDKGVSAPVDRVEYVYEKLVSLFGLGAADTGSSNKEKVLQYCTRLKVLPPVERSSASSFVLRLNGKITFYDLEGSGSKAEAVQQAARAALEALCGVLDKAAVNQNNHKGALQELLVRFKQPLPGYLVTDSPAGHGDRVTWLPEADPTGGLAEGSGLRYQEVEGTDEGAHAEIGTPMKRMITDRSDRPSKMSKVLPSTAGGERPDGGQVLGSVEVTIKVDLRPHQAADREGAVGAAYSDLMKALSLSPAPSGEEKQAVLEFFRQTQCCPPVEKIDPRPDGTYSCSLRIDGKLTFQSPERSTKKESDSLAAQKALAHLEGLQTVKDLKLPGEVKGRLQKVAADLGNICHPVYDTADAVEVTDGGQVLGSVEVTIKVDLRPHQAADQEGAVGAAYSDLMKALSLSPAPSGEEKQAVLEFFRQTQCCPPVEKIDHRPDGTYSCSLRIDGKLTFQSPERSNKKESDSLAAQKALAHLEGLQTVKDLKLPGEVKGRLQKVAADLGNICHPVYDTADAVEVTDGGQVLGSVEVTIKVDLRPHQAADQEGAVGAAYSDLMKALSLSPAPSGEEKQAVLEFFRQTQCCPPVEKIDHRPDGTYSCSLRIDGKLTFQSPERSNKKESDSLAAQKALAHLEGLQTVKDLKLPGEVKGRLQKVAADLGNICHPVYDTADAVEVTDGGQVLGSVEVTIKVDLRPHQAADQEGAVGAAYSDLMKALSLSPAPSGEEKQAVLEFFRQTQCCPPVEKIDHRPDGTYSCSLRIDGKLTFQSPERSNKKESDSLAAQKALAHLEGLQTVKDLKLPGEVKGRLQKVAADLGNICHPVYDTADAVEVTDGGQVLGSVEVTIKVDLRPHQAADQEGAVGAAYSDLMKALSLSPAPSGGERLAVLHFMQLTKSRPPVEDIKMSSDGTYKCALKIDGPFIFQSPERSSTKKEAEKAAAGQALGHLEGLLRAHRRPLPVGDNHKSRLQELLMSGLGNAVLPAYAAVDANEPRHT
ncbi:uncharacterized protein LOC132463024 isoform X3 [Gadus macrocephalus]|uniref:uncharacterized protein LOC132463024 isoform X3 n=1 Tax=Gadus macrocephalus TaxID=80720 RepID=UPI0028CB4181|nr:uncharacterized protein LOC132463024 isoform X3 [Gadus macrocephalus]